MPCSAAGGGRRLKAVAEVNTQSGSESGNGAVRIVGIHLEAAEAVPPCSGFGDTALPLDSHVTPGVLHLADDGFGVAIESGRGRSHSLTADRLLRPVGQAVYEPAEPMTRRFENRMVTG